MYSHVANNEMTNWLEIIFLRDDDDSIIQDIFSDQDKFRKIFIERIAENLYEDMRRSRSLITAPFTIKKKFRQLSSDEKKVWYDYTKGIPEKLKSLNLFIRPFTDFCRTCIITDEEIEKWIEVNDEDQTDDILVIGIKI